MSDKWRARLWVENAVFTLVFAGLAWGAVIWWAMSVEIPPTDTVVTQACPQVQEQHCEYRVSPM